jgi:uncharacterized protein YdaU (DUF1376 family)
MNYFEKHIGDYIRDTVMLTMLEDGAYNRLMDQMYQTERALPADKKMVYRLARASSSAEREAVDFVLETFFTLTTEGYEQKRIKAEIERYQEKQRKAKASADARWNKSKKDANASQTHDAPDMRTHSEGNAHQTPDTRHQTQTLGDRASTQPELGAPEGVEPTPVGLLSQAMRAFGINGNPGDLRLIALADQGVSVETMRAACEAAKKAKPNESIPPAYVLSIVERWAKEAATLNATGATQPQQANGHAYAPVEKFNPTAYVNRNRIKP